MLAHHLDTPRPARARRSRRVIALLVAVMILSAIDLLLTIRYLGTTGMFESNPIVVMLVEWTGSAAAIALFKLVSVGTAVTTFYELRRHPQAELGAWVAVVIMGGLSVQWARYAREVAGIDAQDMILMRQLDSSMISLD